MKRTQTLVLICIIAVSAVAFGSWLIGSAKREPVIADASERVAGSTLGVFVYANDEARFYPFFLVAEEGGVRDALGGVSFELYGSNSQAAVVLFTGVLTLPYEFTTLSEAQYDFPGVLVYGGK